MNCMRGITLTRVFKYFKSFSSKTRHDPLDHAFDNFWCPSPKAVAFQSEFSMGLGRRVPGLDEAGELVQITHTHCYSHEVKLKASEENGRGVAKKIKRIRKSGRM